MPDLLLELFSEEIPARMQVRAADDLQRLVAEVLAPLSPADIRQYSGPRRIALAVTVADSVPARRSSERGPRVTAPEQAVAGFLRKHGATPDMLRTEGDFLVLERAEPAIPAADLIAREMPALLRRFPWPKSMRWGHSRILWVRPLRRILCILDGEVVPFDLRQGDDDGHGLASGNLTEGHRFLSPGAFAVRSEAEWLDGLRARHVLASLDERRARIRDDSARLAAAKTLSVVSDDGLLDEVAGLVEWPVCHLGRIDDAYMDLPPEVMQVSMRVNQRYFALRDAEGRAAPWFAFAANVEADDCGAAIVAGNERVLRARFSDARHFWDLDRQRTLESRVEDLKAVVFHAKLGTQYERALRLEWIAGEIASFISGFAVVSSAQASRAGLLCKADLTTGMVGEFPELQGVMGRYYALNERGDERRAEDRSVADAVRDHYLPRGQEGNLRDMAPVSMAVAIADKLDQLVQFFTIGERPSGSGDPLALRRAGLGVIRILLDNQVGIDVRRLISFAGANDAVLSDVFEFLEERLRIQLRTDNVRPDVVAAIQVRHDPVFVRVERQARELAASLPNLADVLASYRRANNILHKEGAKDGPLLGMPMQDRFVAEEERRLFVASNAYIDSANKSFNEGAYGIAAMQLVQMRTPLAEFFDKVTVNHPDPLLRENRLLLLRSIRDGMNRIADFSKIQG